MEYNLNMLPNTTIELDETLTLLQRSVQDFAQKEIAPLAQQIDWCAM